MSKGYMYSTPFFFFGCNVKFRVTMVFENSIAKRVINMYMITQYIHICTGYIKTRDSMTNIWSFVFLFNFEAFCRFIAFFSDILCTEKNGMSLHGCYWSANFNVEMCGLQTSMFRQQNELHRKNVLETEKWKLVSFRFKTIKDKCSFRIIK